MEAPPIGNLTFEQALTELESTVAQLEGGDLTLESSLTLFERGQKLADFCNQQLDQATLRVEQRGNNDEITTVSVS